MQHVHNTLDRVNTSLTEYKPVTLVLTTTGALVGAYALNKFVCAAREHPGGASGVIFGSLVGVIKKIPGASGKLDQTKKELVGKIKKGFPKLKESVNLELPTNGLEDEALLKLLLSIRDQEIHRYTNHKLSGTIYIPDDKHISVMAKAYELFMNTNPLHNDTFSSTQKFESEVIRMTASLFSGKYVPDGDDGVVGCMTSGGTESILMAMKTFRDKARVEKPHILKPEIIAPKTAHAAFEKACQYLNIKLVHVNVDSETFTVRAEDVRKRINSNTIGLVGSAPNFSQGTIDPIRELAQLAIEFDLSLHVDCCLGGFFLPFAKMLNSNIPDFDFRIPGVTTISADTHKYGLAPKGSSVLLFNNKHTRKYMYFLSPNWMGGMYASPTMPGSRPGALIATCWAAMMRTGLNGYINQARDITKTMNTIIQGIKQIPELELLGTPYGPVVSWTAKGLDIYQINDAMHHAGWSLNTLQNPKSLHICVTSQHVGMEDEFVKDLKHAVYEVVNHPEKFVNGMAPVYGLAVALPDKGIVTELISDVVDLMLDV